MAIQNLGAFREDPLLAENPGLVRTLEVFSEISNHPRPSKNEGAVRDHLKALAEAQGWAVEQDAKGNIAMKVPATRGREDVMPVVMQGHMDMVTFPADALLTRRAEIVDKGSEGDEQGLWMQTVGQEMTLGADNGIGVSLAIATMMDPVLEHGPVTILVTVDEEKGMSGAKNLDPKLLPEGKSILLNLDSEEGSDKICIGCAGSADTVAFFHIGDREALPEGYSLLDLELKGFPGGHSGVEIHRERGNAIQSMADLLSRLQTSAGDLKLVKIEGGEQRNAVPSTARATIAVPDSAIGGLEAILQTFVEEVKKGKDVADPSVTGELLEENAQNVEASLVPTASVEAVGAFNTEFKNRILGVIAETPQGPFLSAELPNVGKLVTLSNNLGLVGTDAENVELISMTRGANVVELSEKLAEIRDLCVSRGGSLTQAEEPTSGWLEDPTQSPAVSIVTDAVREAAGSAEWMAYHAGLESGIVTGKARGSMSAVAIGPLILGAHTPRERVHLQSIVDELKALRAIFAKVVALEA